METEKWSNRRIMVLLALIILLLGGLLLFVLISRNSSDSPASGIGYAQGVTVVDDPDALQKAVDEMYQRAAEGTMALEYQNDAESTDGINFECYIANASANSYDMYIQIFSDAELSDQLFLSGLIRPGQAFDSLALEHRLERGTNTVYVAFTQVEEDLETIHAQVMVTMDFRVT